MLKFGYRGNETGDREEKEKSKKASQSQHLGRNPKRIEERLAESRSEKINNKSHLPGIHPVQICPGEG